MVATMIYKNIRHRLPKYVPNKDKNVFSSKYLFILSVTKIAYQKGVEFLVSHGHSGHSLGTNKKN